MGALSDLSLSAPVLLGWAAWLAAGLALAAWARHARSTRLEPASPPAAPRPVPVRPPSGVRAPRAAAPPPDAFSELQAMLEPPPPGSHRPGEEPPAAAQ